jgi:small-conductance mechanosensitive channel
MDVRVARGTDLERAKKVMVDAGKNHPDVLRDPEPQCWFIDFSDSSLNLSLFCRVADYNQQWRVGEELRLKINQRFQEEGIEIPFPQHDVHLKGEWPKSEA